MLFLVLHICICLTRFIIIVCVNFKKWMNIFWHFFCQEHEVCIPSPWIWMNLWLTLINRIQWKWPYMISKASSENLKQVLLCELEHLGALSCHKKLDYSKGPMLWGNWGCLERHVGVQSTTTAEAPDKSQY